MTPRCPFCGSRDGRYHDRTFCQSCLRTMSSDGERKYPEYEDEA